MCIFVSTTTPCKKSIQTLTHDWNDSMENKINIIIRRKKNNVKVDKTSLTWIQRSTEMDFSPNTAVQSLRVKPISAL